MDCKLIWTDRALSDLAEIVRHYREDEKSLEAAQKGAHLPIDGENIDRNQPFRGRERQRVDAGSRFPIPLAGARSYG